MNKDRVDCCRKEDVPAVVRLHREVYGAAGAASPEDLATHYDTVLFENPWFDEEIPSLVFRMANGEVGGLLGVLVYRMNYGGKSIRMAVPHSFMVAPECRSPMAAMQLIRTLFDGPQDLVVGDGANDQARQVLEAMGGQTSHLYSMQWLSLLRPCSYFAHALGRRRGLKLLANLLQPGCYLLDALAHAMQSNATRRHSKLRYSAVEIDETTLLACIADLTRKSPLYPEYCQADIQWFWDYLKHNARRGRSQAFELRDEKGRRMGSFMYYLRAKKYMEVVFLRARKDSASTVFDHLMDHASRLGAISIEGRMDPCFIKSISDHNCLAKNRRWVIAYSKDPAIVQVIHRGDAMLSPMEGELWVHALSDKLHS